MSETYCIKRDTWITMSACDCNDFMMGWYHSAIRSRAMKEYELQYEAEASAPIRPLEESKND